MIHKTRLTGAKTASEGVIECYTVMFWCGSSCILIFLHNETGNESWFYIHCISTIGNFCFLTCIERDCEAGIMSRVVTG